MSIRVLLADDDARFRAALRERLQIDPRFEVVGEAATGHGLPALVVEARADVVILDVRMPGGGVEAATALREQVDPAPVVVGLSTQSSATTVAAMLAAGATGFLTKGRGSEDLPEMIARCAAGEVVLSTTRVGD